VRGLKHIGGVRYGQHNLSHPVVIAANGERIGTFKTDAAGKVIVPDLETGTYIVSETIAPDGYILNEIPKTVVVNSGKLTTVEFANNPLSGIQILKTDAQTNARCKARCSPPSSLTASVWAVRTEGTLPI
jgi:hypothetical protein